MRRSCAIHEKPRKEAHTERICPLSKYDKEKPGGHFSKKLQFSQLMVQGDEGEYMYVVES